MDAIENAAYVSIGRACGFAGLGIFCVMFGLSFDPAYAAQVGGIMCLGTAGILSFRAWTARTRPYKKTELWIIIAKDSRPPATVAQKVIGTALRDVYLWFAQSAAIIAFVLLISALVLHFAPGAEKLGISECAPTVSAPTSNTTAKDRRILFLPTGPGFDFLETP
ncbi:MAG: hypothetical protein HOK25_12815 [Rhodospirillaceae bacterium]|nr:hypothetical protein [Rhodospirillaceae bacterium]